ncbi:MAG: hypothetical protein KAH23_04285, partial [Kiritimatiellae bacterium]|nr:hypothetical protein [Kiritimatiellia bacterium]
RESFETCACEPERRTEIDCKTTCGKYIPVWKWKPSGWWGTNEWPPGGYYNFYTDFFLEAGEDRTSIFEQWAYNRDVTRIMINRYLDKGYPSYSDAHKCFNYINNIYPEQSSIMDYRWKYGGYDVTWFEYRINKTYVYQTFSSWYTGVVPETTKEVFFVADEQTVKGFTDIAKTNTRAIFERDEHILEELLGPKHCISWNYQGECTSFGYGDFLTEEEIYIIWGDGSGVDELIDDLWPEGELSEHHFVVHYNPSFESMSEQYINSSTYRDLCFGMHGVNPSSAFYSVEHSDGKIGGQYIYNNGLGNEHRDFMQFSEFLREQGWTLDDFMNIYSAQVDDRCNELILAATKNTPVKASNFSEFYDKNHKAPFDGIEYYIPMIPILDEDESDLNNMVRVEKKKIIVDQNGVESISDVDDEIVLPGDFTSSINKDEFISSVTANGSLRVFISNYMRIKMSIKFNSEYATTQVVKLRVSTSDLTYLNEREFKYYE